MVLSLYKDYTILQGRNLINGFTYFDWRNFKRIRMQEARKKNDDNQPIKGSTLKI